MGRMYDEVEYTITDMKGTIVLRKSTQHAALIPITINAAKGTYLINVTDRKQHQAVMRIVIQ